MPNKAIVGIVAAATAVAGWYLYDSYWEESEPLTLYGNVDIREVNLGFRVSGKLARVLKDEGDLVQAGDLLAQIDPVPYRWDVAEAEANLALLEADYRMKKSGYRTEDVAQARAAVAEREATLKTAQLLAGRYAKLLKDGAISRQEADNAEASAEEAWQRLKAAKQNLEQLESGYRVEEVESAKAQVDQAIARLEAAKVQLADTELHAPSEGTILTRALEPGAIVQAGTTVLTLSLNKPVWVRAYVDEPNLGLFPPGTQVRLTTDGRPHHPFKGQVGFVSPRAEFTPKSVETPELRTSLVYRLRIVVANPDPSLRQGMPVSVVLQNRP